MQELLAAADVLITDYSSCMWDFALTDKPGFLYFPDVRQFDRNKDFYTQPEEWPYEYAESTEALRQLILSYDPEKAEKRRNAFFEKVGNYEKGTACAQLAGASGNQEKGKQIRNNYPKEPPGSRFAGFREVSFILICRRHWNVSASDKESRKREDSATDSAT